jgi:phosphoribosyl-AMP cyclohydrolase
VLLAAGAESLNQPAKGSAKLSQRIFWSTSVVILQQAMFMNPPDNHDREQGSAFLPKFDQAGLLSAVALDADSREVLMLAFMDEQALARTRETGLAHFRSRSRGRLWMKGESSGHVLRVLEIRVDCDQDAIVLLVRPEGPACHTGATSCFYRRLDGEVLTRIDN